MNAGGVPGMHEIFLGHCFLTSFTRGGGRLRVGDFCELGEKGLSLDKAADVVK